MGSKGYWSDFLYIFFMENINYEWFLDIDGYYKENLELIEFLKNNR